MAHNFAAEDDIATLLLPALMLTVTGALLALVPRSTLVETVIGRALGVDLNLTADPFVSAVHASIEWDPTLRTHVIMDRQSRNGTYVDDVRVTGPIRLADGARIRVGRTEMVYQS